MTLEETGTSRVLVLGVGAFTQAMMRRLRDDGARVSAYLTRDYAHQTFYSLKAHGIHDRELETLLGLS